jgi:hypothetical protein
MQGIISSSFWKSFCPIIYLLFDGNFTEDMETMAPTSTSPPRNEFKCCRINLYQK